jgi:hypothetical protein
MSAEPERICILHSSVYCPDRSYDHRCVVYIDQRSFARPRCDFQVTAILPPGGAPREELSVKEAEPLQVEEPPVVPVASEDAGAQV